MNIAQSLEVAYLPNNQNPIELDHNELNDAYAFCIKHKVRAFVTYPSFIPYIESRNYQVRLVSVIDFPEGTDTIEDKLIEAGRAYELGKRASAGELDIVLSPNRDLACKEILSFGGSSLPEKIGIKYILEISKEKMPYLDFILDFLNRDTVANNFKFWKTSTGKKALVTFKDKLEICKHIREKSNKPIKVSGGVQLNEIETYKKELGENTVFGISYGKIKDLKSF